MLFVALTLGALVVVALIWNLSERAEAGDDRVRLLTGVIVFALILPAMLGVFVALFLLSIRGCDENCEPAVGWEYVLLWIQFVLAVGGALLLGAALVSIIRDAYARVPLLVLAAGGCFFAWGLILSPGGHAFGI